jgi:hypothetical protein
MGDALTSHSPQLVWALPTTGKTTNLPTAIAETGLPTTILTQRGRVEKYDEIKERCMAAGLQPKILPNFFERCPCASGAFGEDLADLYEALYTGGVSPREIHAFADYHGIPTPCQDNGRCPYSAAWDFDLAEYDVLIGHPTHAYVPSVVHGRAIVCDEFIGAAYTTQLGNTDRRSDTFDGDLQDTVTVALNRRDGLSFDSYSDLLANRDAPQRRADALAWFETNTNLPDGEGTDDVFEAHDRGHTAGLQAVYVILAGEPHGPRRRARSPCMPRLMCG